MGTGQCQFQTKTETTIVELCDREFESDWSDRLKTSLQRPQKMEINSDGNEDTPQVIRDGMKNSPSTNDFVSPERDSTIRQKNVKLN